MPAQKRSSGEIWLPGQRKLRQASTPDFWLRRWACCTPFLPRRERLASRCSCFSACPDAQGWCGDALKDQPEREDQFEDEHWHPKVHCDRTSDEGQNPQW